MPSVGQFQGEINTVCMQIHLFLVHSHPLPSRPLSRKDDPKVKELFDDIEKLRSEFDSIERPTLEMETPKAATPTEKLQESLLPCPTLESTQPKPDTKKIPESQPALDPAAELAKLESEFGKVGQDYSAAEIGDWEFDELERELRSGDYIRHIDQIN